jgi:hypothetical protein
MNASLLINWISLVFSVLAITTSTVLALRQSRLMHQANLLLVLTDLFDQFRASEFKRHMAYLDEKLWSAQPPATTTMETLIDEARAHVGPVSSFFNTVGLLVANRVIDGVLVVSYMGGSIRRAWRRLEPYIRNERERINDPLWNGFFENLAVLAIENPPEKLNARLRLRKMPISSINAVDTPLTDEAEI